MMRHVDNPIDHAIALGYVLIDFQRPSWCSASVATAASRVMESMFKLPSIAPDFSASTTAAAGGAETILGAMLSRVVGDPRDGRASEDKVLSVFKSKNEDAMMVRLVIFHSRENETYLC
jgi:hypothetical protein